jgi:hypothetical protein
VPHRGGGFPRRNVLTGFATGLLAILIAAEPATSTVHEYPAPSHWGRLRSRWLVDKSADLLSVSNFAQSSLGMGPYSQERVIPISLKKRMVTFGRGRL